ncbi:class I SAM-dependent methyltransferase [Shouchella clausii]|uniref:class I SAM-dependent methyltransferase n=1 Tax=Shouchella clausii TaxID=79880 RepID=UPI000BA7CC1B|nr:class I SAM-dependent methyltransferase [Shouchella clausii]MEB5478931.1 class I SAM-dependent methyltransferase [Shouchella clausii]PAD16716.1 methyltransferase type 12 [Shouchella clausii]
MSTTSWKLDQVTEHYLKQVRGGIPYGADQTKMMLHVISHFQSNPVQVLDLGCGNGFLAKLLLQTFSGTRAVLVDHSKPMLHNAAQYMAELQERCTFVEADLEDDISAFAEPESMDCIVSGYAIHHLTHDRKKKLYAEIFNTLKPGGVFINVEHTASATAELEQLHDALFVDHLAAYNNRPRAEVEEEYENRPDKADNILENVYAQVEWLRQIGFCHADCYFKWMELAVFGGVKPR